MHGFAKVTRDETAKHQANVDLQQALERARTAEAKLRRHAEELEQHVAERTELLTRQSLVLKQTNAELEQFAYIASHDLKEPLRMITTYLDLLRQRAAAAFDERSNEYLDHVQSSASRMSELVEAVLEYSRTGAEPPSLDAVPLDDALQTAIAAQQTLLDDSRVDLRIGPLPTVRGNRIHLARVFQNLMNNACKFRTEKPLVIAIDASVVGPDWVISVSDNGIGIDAQFHDRLFKIFQRLHAPDEFAGTGIGLASCRKIIENHGGRIWVESASGGGSSFKFILPKEP